MQTVIAAFENRGHAERAREQLVRRGFERDDVHIEQQDSTSATPTQGATQRHGASGIAGFFEHLFGGEDEYQRQGSTWNEAVRRGSAVVVIDVQDEARATEVIAVLHESGAIDVDERARQWRSEGWTGGAQPTGLAADARQPMQGQATEGKERVLDVVQEELQVGKRALDRGGVRVVQRVSERPVHEVVRLREERAVVDRRPVDRPADAGELNAFKEGTVEVREMSEEAVVAKSARVVEEVRVGKEVREREEVIEDKLRRKDVDVEQLQGGATRERAVASDDTRQPLPEARDPEAAAGTRKTNPERGGPL